MMSVWLSRTYVYVVDLLIIKHARKHEKKGQKYSWKRKLLPEIEAPP